METIIDTDIDNYTVVSDLVKASTITTSLFSKGVENVSKVIKLRVKMFFKTNVSQPYLRLSSQYCER